MYSHVSHVVPNSIHLLTNLNRLGMIPIPTALCMFGASPQFIAQPCVNQLTSCIVRLGGWTIMHVVCLSIGMYSPPGNSTIVALVFLGVAGMVQS